MTDTITDPTPADIALLQRLETVMKQVHDVAPAHCRWTDTARAALNEIADWQQEQEAERESA